MTNNIDLVTDQERLGELALAVDTFSIFPKVQMCTEDAQFLIQLAMEALQNRSIH